MKFNKTDAAETMATHVRAVARESGSAINKGLVEAIISEFRGGHHGYFLQARARVANWRTTLRIALREAKAQGEL
ncbi:MAG: hypothetical protein ACRDTI_21110 [Mycobacterium sp.]